MRRFKGIKYLKWKRSYHYSNMNFLVLTPKPKTSYEEEERGQINGVGP